MTALTKIVANPFESHLKCYVLPFYKISDYFTRANKQSSGKVNNMKPEYPSNGSSMFWSHLAFKTSVFGPFLSI